MGRLLGILFGVLFAGFGLVTLSGTAVPTFLDWQAMRHWQPVAAELSSVTKPGSGVRASYRYEVAGTHYVNDRVSVARFDDTIGAYQETLYQRLQRLRRNQQPLTVWVDPQDPARAVIDREMRWGLFALVSAFCLVFFLIGLVVVIASLKGGGSSKVKKVPGLRALRRDWKARAKAGDHESFLAYVSARRSEGFRDAPAQSLAPGESPWLARKGWQTSRIRSHARQGMFLMWGFAVFWSAVTSPILFVLNDELDDGNYAVLLGLLFPLVGLILLKKAWAQTREWRRFGIIELEMDPFPGALGGHVGGELLVKRQHDPTDKYRLTLESVYSYVSGSGNDRSRRESILWAEQGVAASEPVMTTEGPGTRLAFRFDVPDNLHASDVEQTGDYYFWRLRLQAALPGVDLNRSYNIPVFPTGERSRHITHDLTVQAEEARQEAAQVSAEAISLGRFDQTALARSLRLAESGGALRLYFPMFRNKALTLVALLFALAFGGAATGMLWGGEAGWAGVAMGLFAIPFALVGLVATLAALYLPLNNLRVFIGDGQLYSVRRLFIVPIRRQRAALSQVRRLALKRSGSTGQGINKVEHFRILAYTDDLRSITLAEDIDGKVLATQFMAYLADRMGV